MALARGVDAQDAAAAARRMGRDPGREPRKRFHRPVVFVLCVSSISVFLCGRASSVRASDLRLAVLAAALMATV